MLILNSQTFSDDELLNYAQGLSTRPGGIREKLLHWEFGPLMTMLYDKTAKNYLFSDEGVPFHWDGAFHQEPKKLLFYCTESEGKGGETLFVNTEKIWSSLSETEQNTCKKVKLTYRTQKLAHYGGEIHLPLVQTHPDSGNVILRLAERVSSQLNPVELIMSGISHAAEFYLFLQNKLYESEFLYEHQWCKGDLVISDNFTYLHGRKALGNNRSRTFKRIQIL